MNLIVFICIKKRVKRGDSTTSNEKYDFDQNCAWQKSPGIFFFSSEQAIVPRRLRDKTQRKEGNQCTQDIGVKIN
jgi:hypothetical protein